MTAGGSRQAVIATGIATEWVIWPVRSGTARSHHRPRWASLRRRPDASRTGDGCGVAAAAFPGPPAGCAAAAAYRPPVVASAAEEE